jgi:hypothetical protein
LAFSGRPSRPISDSAFPQEATTRPVPTGSRNPLAFLTTGARLLAFADSVYYFRPVCFSLTLARGAGTKTKKDVDECAVTWTTVKNRHNIRRTKSPGRQKKETHTTNPSKHLFSSSLARPPWPRIRQSATYLLGNGPESCTLHRRCAQAPAGLESSRGSGACECGSLSQHTPPSPALKPRSTLGLPGRRTSSALVAALLQREGGAPRR